MTAKPNQDRKHLHKQMLRDAWSAYHPDYMGFFLKERPDFYSFYSNGGVSLVQPEVELLGDVSGLRLLDTSCGCDAQQAFSWENLGAEVVGSDLSPVAIKIARENARKIGSGVEFVEADAQTLDPFPSESFDIVYSTYICWFEDLFLSCRNWNRVLKPGGRLLLTTGHPLTSCLDEEDGVIRVSDDYLHPLPEYSVFDGTPLADRFGGYQNDIEIVEFFHPIGEIVNAIVEAGFCMRRMVEPRHLYAEEETTVHLSKLPNLMIMLCEKPE